MCIRDSKNVEFKPIPTTGTSSRIDPALKNSIVKSMADKERSDPNYYAEYMQAKRARQQAAKQA